MLIEWRSIGIGKEVVGIWIVAKRVIKFIFPVRVDGRNLPRAMRGKVSETRLLFQISDIVDLIAAS